MAGIGGKGILVGVVVAILVVSVVLAAIMTGFRSAPKVEKPPTAPTGLQAVSGDGQITLSWQPPANSGSSAIKGYRVYRSTSPGTETPQMDIGNMQRYIDGNLNNGQPYYYKVSAVNSMGEGPLSNEASAVPGSNATAPSEPRNLAASAGDAKVSLSWIAPQSDGGSPVLTYIIYRGVAAGAESYLTDAGNSLNYVNTGLVNNITYFYKVGARNAAGEGPKSAGVNATPTGNAVMPGPPRNLKAMAGAGNISLAWDPPAFDGGSMVTGYSIFRGFAPGSATLLTALGNLTSYSDTGLLAGVKLYYSVSARTSLGEGPRCAEQNATTFQAPGAPVNLGAAAGLGRVTLTWGPPASDGGSPILKYLVYRGTAPAGEVFLVLLGVVTTFTDPDLINGTTYYYMVSASNLVGDGPRSAEVNATPQSSFAPPSAPQNLKATPGDSKVALSWEPPANAGGSPLINYTVYRNASVLAIIGPEVSYLDSAVVNGISYHYEVSAVTAIGEGPKSNGVDAVPATLPAAPQNLTASGGNMNVALGWLPPSSDGGSAITNYTVFRNGSFLATIGNLTSYQDTGLTNGANYTYKVAALNPTGMGNFSNEANATPFLNPVAYRFGGPGSDSAEDVDVDMLGNIYLTGYFCGTVDFDGGPGVAELTSAGGTDIFVVKYDHDGKYLWSFSIGGSGEDAPHSITVRATGGFVLAGYFMQVADFDPGAGAGNLASYGGTDAFIAKYDENGTYKWALGLGSTGNDEATDATADDAGNIYATGFFWQTVVFDPGVGAHSSASIGLTDIFIASYDTNGAYRWHASLGSFGEDQGTGIAAVGAGGCFVTGSFNGSVDLDPGAPVNLTNSSGYTDIFLARYDAGGNYVWADGMGGPERDRPATGGIALDTTGGVYLTGTFSGTADFDPTNLTIELVSNGLTDAFIGKYGADGVYGWSVGIGGPQNDAGQRIAVDGSGNIYITGHFQGTVNFDPIGGTAPLTSSGTGGAADIFMAKYAPGGVYIWAYAFGASVSGADQSSAGMGLCIDSSGYVIIAGRFCGPVDFDPTAGVRTLTSAGLSDAFIVRFDSDGKPV